MATQKKIPDIDGTEAVTPVLHDLLNSFPGWTNGEKVEFSTLGETSGVAFYATSGAVLDRHTEDVTGHVVQVCSYPFTVICRVALKTDAQRTRMKELLDALGRWLEQQPVTVNGTTYKLPQYPDLSAGNRKITSIRRVTPAFLNNVYQDKMEDWALSARLTYENEFER